MQVHIYSKNPSNGSNGLHIAIVTLYGKHRPRAQKHDGPVRPENTAHVPHDGFRRKRAGIAPSAGHELVRGLAADDQENLPDDHGRRAEKRHGAHVDESDEQDGESRLPAEDPSDDGDRKDEVNVARVAVECHGVEIGDVDGVGGADGTVGTERNEVPLVVAADARRRQEAVVVARGDTVPAQRAVVRTSRHVHAALGTVPPVAARQSVAGDARAETVLPPDEQEIPENLQQTNTHPFCRHWQQGSHYILGVKFKDFQGH